MKKIIGTLLIIGAFAVIGYGIKSYVDTKIATQERLDYFQRQIAKTPSLNGSNSLIFGSFAPSGGGTYRLGQSIGTSDSTIKLSSFTEPVSGIKYTMSYFGSDKEYGTLSPQSTVSEFISFSGITQNSDGTATLTGVVRGLSRTPAGSACVASTTLAQPHAGQSIFILSNSPCFYNEYTPLRTTATSTAILTFSSTTPPRLDQPSTQASGSYIATTSEFATVAYVNATGAGVNVNATQTVKGIVQLATGAQTASSTALGTTGASLVLQAANATDTPSTPQTLSASMAVITDLTGYIKQAFLNLSQAFTWTGTQTFNATTTILANSTTSAPFKANGIAYSWPASQTASSTTLTIDANGGLSWNYPSPALFKDGTVVTTTNTATTTAKTYKFNAGVMGPNDQLRLTAVLTGGGASFDKVWEFDIGSGTATTTMQIAQDTATTLAFGQETIKIYNLNATNSQTIVAQFVRGAGSAANANVFATSTVASLDTSSVFYISISQRTTNGGESAGVKGVTIEKI